MSARPHVLRPEVDWATLRSEKPKTHEHGAYDSPALRLTPLRVRLVEKIMRAADPVGWRWYDAEEDPDHLAKPIFKADALSRAVGIMEAIAEHTMAEEKKSRALTPVHSSLPLLDTDMFDHMARIANAIAMSSLIPAHLRGETLEVTKANLFRVVNQAVRWNADPFALLDETYMARGRLGYQGKLIAAIINAKADLEQRLSYSYNDKTGDDLEITVHGLFRGEDEERTVMVRVGDVKTNNPMWERDPRQKLIYTGATKWARAYAPELMLGILTDDDIELMEAAPLTRGADGVYAPPRPTRERLTNEEVARMNEAAKEAGTIAAPSPSFQWVVWGTDTVLAVCRTETLEGVRQIEADISGNLPEYQKAVGAAKANDLLHLIAERKKELTERKTDSESKRAQWRLPEGFERVPEGFVIVDHDGETSTHNAQAAFRTMTNLIKAAPNLAMLTGLWETNTVVDELRGQGFGGYADILKATYDDRKAAMGKVEERSPVLDALAEAHPRNEEKPS